MADDQDLYRHGIPVYTCAAVSEIDVPPRDPDRPTDDPWDANAVRYLLAQPGVAQAWTRGVLMECLREQPNRVRREPGRVEAAARLAEQYGVDRRADAFGSRTLVHFYRTDASAPTYPRTPDERRWLRAAVPLP
jgi:hypothetical protein